MRSRVLVAVSVASTVLFCVACSEPDPDDVPEFTASSSEASSASGDAASPTEAVTPSATYTSVELIPGTDLPSDQVAVVTGLAAFMDDWMAVAGDPTDVSLQTSEHATASGQGVLAGVASTLLGAGNTIQGTLLVDAPTVSFAEVPTTAAVTACFDQSQITLVALDGTELPGEAVSRVGGSASLVQTGDLWQVATLDIGGDPC